MNIKDLYKAGLIEVLQEDYTRTYKFQGRLFNFESEIEAFIIDEMYKSYLKEINE